MTHRPVKDGQVRLTGQWRIETYVSQTSEGRSRTSNRPEEDKNVSHRPVKGGNVCLTDQ